ncbi:hypothetical protein IV203_017984 [Nitzschia inconspicua]|uniref:Uncharacterized protein n=1 Tax=Nitzschia inconspicua TaxID=303405 RepID=A0A9K3M0Z5_9STRA|nr:hypothetical protein IV203_017984 [Nitzschia inconspicua]
MKVLSVLCLILSFAQANAWFSFNFSNLLFATGICKVPGPRCHVHCGGPLHPKKFCGCASDSRRRHLAKSSGTDWCYDSSVCDDFEGSNLEQCLAHANYDEANVEDEGYEVTEVNEMTEESSSESFVSGGHSGTPVSTATRRLNWLPFVIAAAVLSMLAFVAVGIRRKKSNPELQAALDTEDDLHGGVAKRMERIESGRPVNPLRRAGTDTSFVSTRGSQTPYHLA